MGRAAKIKLRRIETKRVQLSKELHYPEAEASAFFIGLGDDIIIYLNESAGERRKFDTRVACIAGKNSQECPATDRMK